MSVCHLLAVPELVIAIRVTSLAASLFVHLLPSLLFRFIKPISFSFLNFSSPFRFIPWKMNWTLRNNLFSLVINNFSISKFSIIFAMYCFILFAITMRCKWYHFYPQIFINIFRFSLYFVISNIHYIFHYFIFHRNIISLGLVKSTKNNGTPQCE